MPLHVSSTCARHQEVKIALHSLWFHHTETSEWSKITEIQFYKYEHIVVYIKLYFCNFRPFQCDDTRGCVMQFWPPDDEHMCSKHVEAWNKIYCKKQKFCASSWLITEINNIKNCVWLHFADTCVLASCPDVPDKTPLVRLVTNKKIPAWWLIDRKGEHFEILGETLMLRQFGRQIQAVSDVSKQQSATVPWPCS